MVIKKKLHHHFTVTKMAFFFFSKKFMLLFHFITSAIPLAIIISHETLKPATHVYFYHSTGWLRDCAKWDAADDRFIVSFMGGGLGQLRVPTENHSPETVLEETVVVKDRDYAGNASLGMAIDSSRHRVVVAVADLFGNRYSAVAAYDMSSWKRLFLTQLAGQGDEKSLADDVAIDAEGNAYVTDAKASKIWKVGVTGELLSTIRDPLFTPKEWYKNIVGVNGIVYHPDGYLLVTHTASGNLLKIEISKGNNSVKLVNITRGSLLLGDGMELISPTMIVVAGNPPSPSGRLVESRDGWETASVVGKFSGPKHRLATAATVKDGRAYISHMVGIGYPKRKHAIVEAVFLVK